MAQRGWASDEEAWRRVSAQAPPVAEARPATEDDGSGTALRHAAIRLNQFPQVDAAGLDYRITAPMQR